MTSARGGSYPGSASRRDRLVGHSWFAAGRCRRQAPRTSASEGPPTRGPAPRRLLSVHCCFPLITGLTTNVTWTSRVVRDQHSREAVRFWGAPPPLWRESPGGRPPGSPGKAARTCGFSTHPRPHARLSAPRRSWGGSQGSACHSRRLYSRERDPASSMSTKRGRSSPCPKGPPQAPPASPWP